VTGSRHDYFTPGTTPPRTTRAKAVAGLLVSGIGQALTLGIVPNPWKPFAASLVTIGTFYGVYKIPNRTVP